MKKLNFLAAISLAFAGFISPAKADLIFAGQIGPGDPAMQAAALEAQFHTGPLTFLGLYGHDPETGAVIFLPGAISDPFQISFMPTSRRTGFVSWDLTGTGFEMRFVTEDIFEGDFDFVNAFRVTPDEFLNSLGQQPPFGINGVVIDFFGAPTGVPEGGSTALLLGSAVAGLWLMRASITKTESARQIGSGMCKCLDNCGAVSALC